MNPLKSKVGLEVLRYGQLSNSCLLNTNLSVNCVVFSSLSCFCVNTNWPLCFLFPPFGSVTSPVQNGGWREALFTSDRLNNLMVNIIVSDDRNIFRYQIPLDIFKSDITLFTIIQRKKDNTPNRNIINIFFSFFFFWRVFLR